MNFEGIDAIGHIVSVRGAVIESYEFDYDSNIHVFHGEFGLFSPRVILVLKLTDLTKRQFLQKQIPIPVNPVLSMIPRKMRGKKAMTYYPIFRSEILFVKLSIALHNKYLRLKRLYTQKPDQVPVESFFDYVIKCRIEYSLSKIF